MGLGTVTTVYYVFFLGNAGRMLHVAHEYVSFIALIGSLFVVAGGIHIDVKGEAKPRVNCLFLFIGAVLANVIGTTGASMLLIRPWMRMNKYRITAFHMVFFIFIVSNVGGCLTPIGDPPLFLSYIKGVPFWWVLQKCWIAWAIAVAGLIGVLYTFDRRNFLRAPREVREAETRREIWKIEGWRNLGFLALILVAVFVKQPVGLSEALMLAAAVGSWFATPKRIHEANDFNFHPIREVAWLFIGIFATMVTALDYLEIHAGERGLNSEMEFFWLTGLLSGALDTCLLLLAAVLLPALARSKARSSRVGCNSNMKQVGMAFLSWSVDNQGRFPMQVPVANGGTMELVGNGTVFPHFQVLSNELNSPKVLRCPNDAKKTSATNFAVGFSDSKLSYFLGLDSAKENNASLLSGDRNLTNVPMPGSALLIVTTNLILGWGRDLHSGKAKVCFGDGSARQVQNGFVTAGTNRLAIP